MIKATCPFQSKYHADNRHINQHKKASNLSGQINWPIHKHFTSIPINPSKTLRCFIHPQFTLAFSRASNYRIVRVRTSLNVGHTFASYHKVSIKKTWITISLNIHSPHFTPICGVSTICYVLVKLNMFDKYISSIGFKKFARGFRSHREQRI